jgi:radical SAM protein with 4Fe4S-binding SPASM domain
MKAEFAPRVDLLNRTMLETVIPLETPYVIFVDPSDACNFKCRFCPTSDRILMNDVGRPLKTMKFDLYKKIVDDICEFPNPVRVLRLYKDGEPLINKHLGDMIKYAKDKGCAERIDTTTNASLLTEKRGKELADAGLDRINISIYGVTNEHYKNFSDVNLEMQRVVDNVKAFYENRKGCEMLVKINGDTISEEDKNKFLEMFGDYTDKIYIEHIMSCWPNFELNGVDVNQDVGLYGQAIREIDVCPYVFYSFAINSDGFVSLCFLDWAKELGIGNVADNSVKSIWQGDKMRRYQKMFLEGRRKKHPICGNCGQMTHGQPDNIDSHKEEILEKLHKLNYFDFKKSQGEDNVFGNSSLPIIP